MRGGNSYREFQEHRRFGIKTTVECLLSTKSHPNPHRYPHLLRRLLRHTDVRHPDLVWFKHVKLPLQMIWRYHRWRTAASPLALAVPGRLGKVPRGLFQDIALLCDALQFGLQSPHLVRLDVLGLTLGFGTQCALSTPRFC